MQDHTKSIKEKIKEEVTLEKVAIAVGSVVAYTYVMSKFHYKMVRPSHQTDTHLVFNKIFGGVAAVRLDSAK